MRNFLDLAYRLPYVRHYKAFDQGFYVDFSQQLRLMGRWLRDFGCRRTLDIGAMTGGCIDHITRLGIRMDGVQFTPDLKRLAGAQLRKAGVASTLYVSPIHRPPALPPGALYDGIVTLGWFNLPFSRRELKRYLARIHRLLRPGGVFLFDFFEFRDLVLPPTESLTLARDLVYVSHSERRGKLLRRYHLWIRNHSELRTETSDLVDRSPRDARRLLAEAGLQVMRTRYLDLHYPRHFWLVQKPGLA
jgi:SAM-dependent methyltransferase